MFGRQIFLEPTNSHRDQRRRNELLQQFAGNQGHGIPFNELTAIPSLRNDGLMLDLNFVLVEDVDRIQPNNAYYRANNGNAPNRYMLEYIRQMEERYLAMERELTRAKMLIPVVTRSSVHRTAQTNVNWKECGLTKYGYLFGTSSGSQYRKSREQVNVSSRKKYHSNRKGKDFSQNDLYPIKEPRNRAYQSRTLNNNSNAVCSMHNVAIILPQDSTQLPDFSKYNQVDPKVNNDIHEGTSKCGPLKGVFSNSRKCFGPFQPREKASMEVCQQLNKKHEPETSYHTDFDVKHEAHTQSKPAVNAREFRPIIGPKVDNDIFDEKPKNQIFENADTYRREESHLGQTFQYNRNHWNNREKKLACERTRCTNDSNHFSRMGQKQKKEMHKKAPTPRSNVYTAYTPMVQSSSWNPMLDPNSFTIQLLRLAVLLYAPALMPALNLLIARQNVHTSIPVPCSEGSNDLLAQIFTILCGQQTVPNLPYVQNSRTNESSQSRETNSQNISSSYQNVPSETLTKDLPKGSRCEKTVMTTQFENNSIAVNTSLEMCTCNSTKPSSLPYSDNILYDEIEESEKLIYTWTNQKTQSSETMMQCKKKIYQDLEGKQGEESSIIGAVPNVWDQMQINNIWDLESDTNFKVFQ